jgi:hypothetical protein
LSFLRIRDFMGGVEPNRENEILGNIMGDRALRSRLSVAPQPGEALGALAFTQTIIRAFNRNTTYFTAGLQLSVGFAILVLAFQEANQNVTSQTEARPNGDKLSLSAHPDLGPAEAVDPSANNIDNLTSIQATKAEPELVPGANLPISRPQIHGLQGKRHFGTFNARNSRSARHRYAGVKLRLLELWRRSLALNKKSHSWFSNSSIRGGNKVSFIATNGH